MSFNNASNYRPIRYNVQVGGTNNNLAQVAPSTTIGIALVSNGSSANPSFSTVTIAGGGTNATSYTQNNGILTYNGTRLVNYAGPQIDSSGRYTNTSQPAFYAYLNATDNNVTGAGSTYTLGTRIGNPLVELYDIGNNFNTETATFTAPVTGYYLINGQMRLTGILSTHTASVLLIPMTAYTWRTNIISPFQTQNISANVSAFGFTHITKMTAGDTMQAQVTVANGTAVVDVLAQNYDTYISARLLD
jgi:hypothetical protein